MAGLGGEDGAEALVSGVVGEGEVLELVEALQIEGEAAALAVDFEAQAVLAAEGEAGGFDGAEGAVFEFQGADDGVIDGDGGAAAAIGERAFFDEGAGLGGDGADFADEVAGEIQGVGGEVAEGTAAGAFGIHAPEAGRAHMGQQPILQVDGAEVVDAAEGAGIDEEAQLADGGDEAVVVGGHVFDAGGAGGFEHGQGFGGRCGRAVFRRGGGCPSWAAAMQGSAWMSLGPPLSRSWISPLASISRQSV